MEFLDIRLVLSFLFSNCNFEVILLWFVLNNYFVAEKSENEVKEGEMEEIKDEVHELQDA
jgi:hypothetical protein